MKVHEIVKLPSIKNIDELSIPDLQDRAKRMEIILQAQKKAYQHQMNRRYEILSWLAGLVLILGIIALQIFFIIYTISTTL